MEGPKNSVLIHAWSMFQPSFWTQVTTAELHEKLVHPALRHFKIVGGLQSRNPDVAAEYMHEHIIELLDELGHHDAHARLNPAGESARDH
jgi:DNA-binding FadR family transcriptional regulator